ncbi:adhesion G protein-coupled receptor E3-like isoform 6-T6 [Anomaloglossus baeobatrachus]|uniref:adhesion G protein-coupled receptor E3-like isoform X3 n=1 Tax=Anomaloglossus baeobatrachus TaxID=238106 RepID=UPI003F4FF66D
MQSSRRLLIYGLCVILRCPGRGAIYVSEKAQHFPQCDPSLKQCPAHSSCEQATKGYYCKCDGNFYNVKEKGYIIYPGGECLEFCATDGSSTPCACRRVGFVAKQNDKGLYACRSVIYVSEKAQHFPQCDPSLKQCPAHSSCEQATEGYYCKCDDNFYNAKEKGYIVYPGGECLEFCATDGSSTPCACRRDGFVAKQNDKGLYACRNKCRNDSDCPPRSSCKSQACYCNDACTQQVNCVTLVKLDGVCTAPSTTTSPVMSSYWTMGSTRVYVQTQVPTKQPVYNRCDSESSTEQEVEKCKKQNSKDPLCIFLKSIENITENACEGNKSNTSVKKVATQITNLLTQTSLKTFNSTELQTLVIVVIEKVETSLLATFATDLRDQTINTPEIKAEMKVSHEHCDKGSSIILEVDKNSMDVPCSLVNFKGGGAIFISYKGLNARLNGSILAAFGNSDSRTREEIISPVVGGAITSDNTENLGAPVNFTLKNLMPLKSNYTPRCVFWDSKSWSTQGCETQQLKEENSTLCRCTHLSTFAVIMAPTEIEVDTGLRIISIIGLSISLVCLCLSFLTLVLCRSLRSAHTSVLTVLCGCLFLGQFLVLVGLQQTQNKILCAVIAGSLQFLFLCAFCWMTLESILLFLTVRNLQAVNYMNSQRSHFPFVCLIGFGIPVIITIISVSLYPDRYGEKTHCWLKISHVWSFLGPVCMFISVNFVLLVLTFWLLRKKLASLNSNVSTLKHTRLLTFKALSQLFILGCTWIIGLLQFGSASLFASYFFTICNSLQGVYIFLIHCLLNRQVREEYNRVFRRLYSKKSTSDTTTGSTLPMTSKPSQVTEASKQDDERSMEKKP